MIGVNRKLNRVQQEMQWTEICTKSNKLCRNWWVRYGESKNLKPYEWDIFYGEGDGKEKIRKEIERKLPPMETKTSHAVDYPDYTQTLCEPTFCATHLRSISCNGKVADRIPCTLCYNR